MSFFTAAPLCDGGTCYAVIMSNKVNATNIQRQSEDRGRAVIEVENSDRLIMYAAGSVLIMTVVN